MSKLDDIETWLIKPSVHAHHDMFRVSDVAALVRYVLAAEAVLEHRRCDATGDCKSCVGLESARRELGLE